MIRLERDCHSELAGAEPLVLDLWKAEAERGVIWVPHTVTNAWAAAMRMALYRLRSKAEVELVIDCTGGCEYSFEPCHELLWRWRESRRKGGGPPETTTVLSSARSIGLSYSVCATRRLAYPDAVWAVHGGSYRVMKKHESGVNIEDHYIADWLARFTQKPYEFWIDLVSDGEVHEFGVAEALEWGVIDEVLEGV